MNVSLSSRIGCRSLFLIWVLLFIGGFAEFGLSAEEVSTITETKATSISKTSSSEDSKIGKTVEVSPENSQEVLVDGPVSQEDVFKQETQQVIATPSKTSLSSQGPPTIPGSSKLSESSDSEVVQIQIRKRDLSLATAFLMLGTLFGYGWAYFSRSTTSVALQKENSRLTELLQESTTLTSELRHQLMEQLNTEDAVHEYATTQLKTETLRKLDTITSAHQKLSAASLTEAESRMKTVVESALSLTSILQQSKGLKVRPNLQEALQRFVQVSQDELQRVRDLQLRASAISIQLTDDEITRIIDAAEHSVTDVLRSRDTRSTSLRLSQDIQEHVADTPANIDEDGELEIDFEINLASRRETTSQDQPLERLS